MESKTQQKLIRYLKSKGCYVLKTRPGPGVPLGCPDIIFLYHGGFGVLEVKAGPFSPFRTLQKETLEELGKWGYARKVYPQNVDLILEELESML